MIRKFATIPGFGLAQSAVLMTVLMGVATLHAQQTPAQAPADPSQTQPQAQQKPDTPDSSSQEASPEDTLPSRRGKLHPYQKWTFNAGGGASLASGTTKTYVRGGGGVAAAGATRNYGPYFGLRADFQFDNLPLKNSALGLAQAPGATDHALAVALGPIINIPVTPNWGGYLVFGAAYVHRSGALDSSTTVPGSACNGFYNWWGSCSNGSLPVNGKFLDTSQNQFGYNVGFALTHKIRPHAEIYAEFRLLHAKQNGITTDVRPITIGVRW